MNNSLNENNKRTLEEFFKNEGENFVLNIQNKHQAMDYIKYFLESESDQESSSALYLLNHFDSPHKTLNILNRSLSSVKETTLTTFLNKISLEQRVPEEAGEFHWNRLNLEEFLSNISSPNPSLNKNL